MNKNSRITDEHIVLSSARKRRTEAGGYEKAMCEIVRIHPMPKDENWPFWQGSRATAVTSPQPPIGINEKHQGVATHSVSCHGP